jgi:hypothetical protein
MFLKWIFVSLTYYYEVIGQTNKNLSGVQELYKVRNLKFDTTQTA